MRTTTILGLLALLLVLPGCKGTAEPKPEPEPDISLPVRILKMPGMTVLARDYTGPYEDSVKAFDEFVSYTIDKKIPVQGDLMGVFHDDPNIVPPNELRWEIRIPVAPGTSAEEPYRVVKVPPVTTAAVVLVGPYERISKRYWEIYEWINRSNWVVAGPLIEVYLKHPGSGVSPEEYETEVHVPVAPR